MTSSVTGTNQSRGQGNANRLSLVADDVTHGRSRSKVKDA